MRAPDYYEKRDQAFKEHKAVEKVKAVIPRGYKTYIKKRQDDLKVVRKGVGNG